MHEPINVDPEIINKMKARLAQESATHDTFRVLYKDWMDDSVQLVRINRDDDEASEIPEA